MSVATEALAYEDLLLARENGNRYELIEGELYLVASPSPLHQRVALRFATGFNAFLKDGDEGQAYVAPVDVRFADGSVVQPDVVVLLPDRLHIVEDTLIEGAPSLIVEVASRSSRSIDRGAKLRVYAANGVPEYWYVEAETRSVMTHAEPTGNGYARVHRETERVRSETMPGVVFELDERFWR
jgi:Uma2 family endonuclease